MYKSLTEKYFEENSKNTSEEVPKEVADEILIFVSRAEKRIYQLVANMLTVNFSHRTSNSRQGIFRIKPRTRSLFTFVTCRTSLSNDRQSYKNYNPASKHIQLGLPGTVEWGIFDEVRNIVKHKLRTV